MAFLDTHGFTARIFYLNILFATMVFLSALFAGTLGASYEDGSGNKTARYETCALAGATVDIACPDILDDTTGSALFDIGVATVVVNAGLFVWSVLAHWDMGADILTKGQILISLLNIGLFAGLVGNLNSVDDLLLDVNVENNVVFSGANPYIIAVFGLAFGVADIVIFNALNMLYFKTRCDVGTDSN
jgi:hypothetical protein